MFGLSLIALFIYHLYVSGRLSALERQIAEVKVRMSATDSPLIKPSVVESTGVLPRDTSAEVRVSTQQSFVPRTVQNMYGSDYIPEGSARPVALAETDALTTWLKQDFLVKLGALLLLIAFGWFVSYAFANNWIGPVGRITLGILAGVMILILGVVRIEKRPSQGAIFTVLGSTTILLTVFAARGIYDFFTPATALVFMFVTVAFVAFVSVRYNREQLAIASLLMGAIAPLLTNTPTPDVTGLSLYLLALVIGTLWVVYRLKSTLLTPLALGVVVLYGLPYLEAASYTDQLLGLLFTFIFTMIFLVTNIVSIVRSQTKDGEAVHYVTAIGTGGYLLVWIMVAAPALWHTPLYLIWMLVFATGSFLVYIKTSNRIPFYIYGSVALALLAAATADLFHGAALTIVYAVELASLIVLANNVVLNSGVARRLALLYIGLGMLSLQHLQFLSGYGEFSQNDFWALLALVVSLGVAGVSLTRTKPDIANENDPLQPGPALLTGSVLYIGLIIWLTLHQSLPAGEATTVSLIIYTVAGLGAYIQGRAINNNYLITAGKIIIGGVVLRLLLIDVWNLMIAQRIIVFFIIGILLLSTAFLKQKPKA